jgi:ATP-binding cassette subfamily F protein 3
VTGFSGGERSRLALAKLLLEPRNLLFLDEPTNHLDIPAAEILEEALTSFEGTVILVSHDRRFLENVTTRVVSVRGGRADVYPGGFRDYEKMLDRGRNVRAAAAAEATAGAGPAAGGGAGRGGKVAKEGKETKDQAVEKFEEQKQAARALEKKRRRVKELETSIASGERELDALRGRLKAAPGDDWEKLAKMAHEEQTLTRKVDAMLVEWARLSEEIQ